MASIDLTNDLDTFDRYHISMAYVTSSLSQDPNTKVGACIATHSGEILGMGYNKFPDRCDTSFPWDREGDILDTKYPYVVHAEMNAILESDRTKLKGAKLYSTMFPCNDCAKLIIQAGITEVYYINHPYADKSPYIASERLLKAASIPCIRVAYNTNEDIPYLSTYTC